MTKFGSAASLAVLALVLGSCEMLDATAGVEPPPAEGRGYPNLGTVPRPPGVAPQSARQSEVDRLMASRDASIREDQELRAVNPGQALPPPRPRAAPRAAPQAARDPQASTADASPGSAQLEQAGPETAPRPAPQAGVTMPRPQLASSLFMGTVVVPNERGALADFQRKVLEDSAAMAKRTNGRVRLVGGRSTEERNVVAQELVRLGVPAERISAAADRNEAARPAIDVLIEN